LAFTANETMLVSCSNDGTTRIWDTDTCRCSFVHDFKADMVSSIALLPSGLMAVALVHAAEVRFLRLGHDEVVQAVAFNRPLMVRCVEGEAGLQVFVSEIASRWTRRMFVVV